MDVDNIPLGGDFRDHITNTLKRCDVLLAIIGSRWLDDSRLYDETDWVRIEIETALAKKIPVIPVLIDQAQVPQPGVLPESLRSLAFRQAARVDSGVDFRQHMERLIRSLSKYIDEAAVARDVRSRFSHGATDSIICDAPALRAEPEPLSRTAEDIGTTALRAANGPEQFESANASLAGSWFELVADKIASNKKLLISSVVAALFAAASAFWASGLNQMHGRISGPPTIGSAAPISNLSTQSGASLASSQERTAGAPTYPTPPSVLPNVNAIEKDAWDSVKSSNDPGQLQSYLDQYPTGVFARIAEAKIAALKRAKSDAAARSSKSKHIFVLEPRVMPTGVYLKNELTMPNNRKLCEFTDGISFETSWSVRCFR